MKKITDRQRKTLDKHSGIVALYASEQYKTEDIAKYYGVSVRHVQRIAQKHGISRTIAEANKVAAPLKNYHTVPVELRVKRKHITHKIRFQMIQAQPWCTLCGTKPSDGIRLEIDHKDEDATNNDPSNLQVLCGSCNLGKSHSVRFS